MKGTNKQKLQQQNHVIYSIRLVNEDLSDVIEFICPFLLEVSDPNSRDLL
jgi:hypothetical protein